MSIIKVSTAQIAALAMSGVYDIDIDDSEALKTVRAAIVAGDDLQPSEELARAVTELANDADELGQLCTLEAADYRKDSRALTALAANIRKAIREPK